MTREKELVAFRDPVCRESSYEYFDVKKVVVGRELSKVYLFLKDVGEVGGENVLD